ncbi:MAG: thioredoxin domain-containing protein [Nanoarchaeota archaeon]
MVEEENNSEHHKTRVVRAHEPSFLERVRENPWIITSIVLAVLLLLVVVFGGLLFGGKEKNNFVSSDTAAQSLMSFANLQGVGSLTLVSSIQEGGLYKVVLEIGGREVPVYVTLDGKNMLSTPPVPLSLDAAQVQQPQQQQQPPAPEVPKSDKPVVELFVMSYCPYGTQMEKTILPVVSVLKEKINFTLRYTHFTLHGEKEDSENFRQICIRQEQPTKFLQYIQCTLNSSDAYSPANVTQCMKSLSIVSSSVDNCIKNKAAGYYKIDSDLSQGYGVQGSPTLVINGVEVVSARSPASVLQTICSSFKIAPSECSVQLPAESASPGFGYSASSGADSAAVQCAV